jgi:hypothetical protein
MKGGRSSTSPRPERAPSLATTVRPSRWPCAPKGGGLTAGKVDIVDGIGDITGVTSIDEVFGKYAAAEASAAAGGAASASVVTKGPASIALSGTGGGMDLGWSFGEFVIERAQVMKGK